MIAGHGALSFLMAQGPFKPGSLWVFVLAAYGPDLIDKPLMWFGQWSGRGIGHSLLLYLLLVVPILLACARKGWLGWGVSLAAGVVWLLHLPMDGVDGATFFYPLLGPFPPASNYSFTDMLRTFYLEAEHPWLLAMDLLLCLAALAWAAKKILRPVRTEDSR